MLNSNRLYLEMHTRGTVEKRTSVKLLRQVLPVVLALVTAAAAAGCGKGGSNAEQRSQLALEQLLSCTLQQAEEFDAAMARDFTEDAADVGAGLVQDDGRLRDYLAERFGDSMTDACIEDLTMSRAIYRSAALSKRLNSDVSAGEATLTKCSDDQERYNFSAELISSSGDPAAAVSGTILMEKDGAGWKASRITLTMDEVESAVSDLACPSVNGVLRVEGTGNPCHPSP